MKVEKIYIGGWFQRTTLHLTEIFDFLAEGKSELELSKDRLTNAKDSLEIESIERKNWLLEYVSASTKNGIAMRIYEDGLMILEREPIAFLSDDFLLLEQYYDKNLSPAISLIFSRGAPVPKELAQIKTLLPFVVVAKKAKEEEVRKFFEELKVQPYSTLETTHISIYKSARVILIVSELSSEKIRQLVEAQIFFREFKAQLHRYLNIHRVVWDEIAEIKERGRISGKEIRPLRAKLSDYQKSIELIGSRINQMEAYLETRAKVSVSEDVDKFLENTFALKYETLADTLVYVQELWLMTGKYLDSTLEMFKDIQAESTKTSIGSLQLITTVGVVAAILGYLERDSLPGVSLAGLVFFAVLILLTWGLNRLVTEYFKGKSYVFRKGESRFNLKEAKEKE